jgi:transposase
MESVGKKAPQAPLVHAGVQGRDPRAVRARDRSVGQVAKDFDLTETAVREWVKQAERDAGSACLSLKLRL